MHQAKHKKYHLSSQVRITIVFDTCASTKGKYCMNLCAL